MKPILQVKDLSVAFAGRGEEPVRLDRAEFSLDSGEILCIVGESGSGKSVTSQTIMGILGSNARLKSGEILYGGEDLLKKTDRQMEDIRGKEISMIFQDVMNSLNPVFTIGFQMTETVRRHLRTDRQKARAIAKDLLTEVGLVNVDALMKKYPHTLSGGMKQRVMIAMALVCNPKILIADEPTTALDVTIQAQIMDLLKKLNKDHGMSVILITHDMGVVAEMADRVLVLYAGQVVEEAVVKDIFDKPAHPYTEALLRSIPQARNGRHDRLVSTPGQVPEDYPYMSGCRFAGRCPYYEAGICDSPQAMREVTEVQRARCHRAGGNSI